MDLDHEPPVVKHRGECVTNVALRKDAETESTKFAGFEQKAIYISPEHVHALHLVLAARQAWNHPKSSGLWELPGHGAQDLPSKRPAIQRSEPSLTENALTVVACRP